ncbi:hypothetical protein ACWC09_28745 [Streptomyces sp. NPDC001617]
MRAVTAEPLRLPGPPGRTSTTPRSRPQDAGLLTALLGRVTDSAPEA